MPELPDLETYVAAMQNHLHGRELKMLMLNNPFVLRSVDPPVSSLSGMRLDRFERRGKVLMMAQGDGPAVALHLMIGGRLQFKSARVIPKGKRALAAWIFEHGTMTLTEAGTERRAWIRLYPDIAAARSDNDRGGLDLRTCSLADWTARLRACNHTIKRALTMPDVVDGVGNAYSDEILHRAGLSPYKRAQAMDDTEAESLLGAARDCLCEWEHRLRTEAGGDFPKKVTAFRPEMAVHGKFGKACPVCETRVARIVRGKRETNYCPGCQTGGMLLADRALSKLLHDDWPQRAQ